MPPVVQAIIQEAEASDGWDQRVMRRAADSLKAALLHIERAEREAAGESEVPR